MRIIFMGTPDFAVATVDAIKKAGHEILLVVTQPDKPRGRSGALAPSDVKKWALDNNIEVFQPVKIREQESVDYLKQFDADIAVVAAFGQILPKEILDMPKYGCINVHASLLPKYRGAAPIQWAILNGDSETGVTIMQMGVGLDDGDIIKVARTPIGSKETGGQLFDRLAILGGETLVEALAEIEEYCISNKVSRMKAVPQNEDLVSHVGMISKQMGLIDFTKSAAEIERYVRGLNPWPSAYTSYNGKQLKIWEAEVEELESSDFQVSVIKVGLSCTRVLNQVAKPGQVVEVTKDSVKIACGMGLLVLKEIQLEGKKRMKVEDFLRGREIKVGEIFG